MSDIISFDRAASFYDETRGFPPEEETAVGALIAQAANLNAKSAIMEIAIGTGRVALPYVRHTGGAIHGIDISTAMMQRIAAKQNGEAIYPAQADAARLPYATGTFDAVLAAHIFHLLPDIPPVEREIRRVLKPSGVVIHCWNSNDSPINQARRKANEAIREAKGRPRNWRQAQDYLPSAGWREINRLTHTYTLQQTPQDVIDSFRNRRWSSTWQMTDDEIETQTQIITEELSAAYDDLTIPVTLTSEFHVAVYEQPA